MSYVDIEKEIMPKVTDTVKNTVEKLDGIVDDLFAGSDEKEFFLNAIQQSMIFLIRERLYAYTIEPNVGNGENFETD